MEIKNIWTLIFIPLNDQRFQLEEIITCKSIIYV